MHGSTVSPPLTRGEDKDLVKGPLLNKYSVLALSRPIVDDHPGAWIDDVIIERSKAIAVTIATAWPIG